MSVEKARRMGWVPKEEFRGDPEKWVEAETFIERGENIMPVLKENYERLDKKFEAQGNRLDKVTTSLEKLAAWHKDTAKRSYERALKDIKVNMRKAAEDGDVESYDHLEKQLDNVEKEVNQVGQDVGGGSDNQISPAFPEWQRSNPWYNSDPDLTAFANAIGPEIAQTSGQIDDKQYFELIGERVRAAFPAKFTNTNQGNPDVVEGAGGGDGHVGVKKTWTDLPADAKQAYLENFANIPDFTKQKYAEDYWLQEDV